MGDISKRMYDDCRLSISVRNLGTRQNVDMFHWCRFAHISHVVRPWYWPCLGGDVGVIIVFGTHSVRNSVVTELGVAYKIIIIIIIIIIEAAIAQSV
jgi:hypothetical protein